MGLGCGSRKPCATAAYSPHEALLRPLEVQEHRCVDGGGSPGLLLREGHTPPPPPSVAEFLEALKGAKEIFD